MRASMLIVFMGLIAGVFGDACSSGAMVAPEVFNALTDRIASQSFDSKKIAVIADFVANSTYGFTGAQTAKLLSLYTFSSSQQGVLDILDEYILSLTAGDIASVISQLTFSSGKIDALSAIVNYGLKSSLASNSSVIIEQFTFSSDKRKAQEIIDNARGRTCTWGAVNQRLVVFVIDVSGSMAATFKLDGQSYTRLSFVQREIDEVIRHELQPFQSFNVISFSSSARAWSPGLQPVNSDNIDTATAFAAGLRPGGGTSSSSAFRLAFDQKPEPLAVYFLSDGQPTDGTTANSVKAILGGRNIQIFCTALAADAGGKAFLKQVAEATGGVYREVNGN